MHYNHRVISYKRIRGLGAIRAKTIGSLYLRSIQRIRSNTASIIVFALNVELVQKVFYMRSCTVSIENLIGIKH
jgi:hypothetical protein